VILIRIFFQFGANSAAGLNAGMTVAQAVSYVWLAQITLILLPSRPVDQEVWEKIRTGDIGIELCRPLDLYAHWFTRAIATRLIAFLLHLIPFTAITMLLPEPYRLQPPASVAGLLACILSLGAGLSLSCSCLGITYAVLMKVHWGEGPANMILILMDILSGSYLPLQLWPDWAQKFLIRQPFAGLMDIPLRFYVGTMAPEMVWKLVALQLSWAMILTAAGWFWIQKNLSRLVIQGG
jgi:ABC-2 type transport system permease protein